MPKRGNKKRNQKVDTESLVPAPGEKGGSPLRSLTQEELDPMRKK